jgi:HPr kinase/phosphorylase
MAVARSITAKSLYDDLHEKLRLRWIAGEKDENGESISPEDLTTRPTMAGFLNLIHPNRVQVLGIDEIRYLESLEAHELASNIARMLDGNALAIVIGDGLNAPPLLLAESEGCSCAVLQSDMQADELVNYLQYHISKRLAQQTTLHGVFMEVFTIGVLITGDPGCGKSELALELLNRGHRLIADDAPEFTRISPEIIDGTCPEALQDCLEVRGLGVLNVRRMFGDAAVKLNKFLRLIVHLEIPENPARPEIRDRLHGDSSKLMVLGQEVPRITLPVVAGRNLAVITEAAVRDFMLKMKGYDAASVFLERHSRLLQRQKPDVDKP